MSETAKPNEMWVHNDGFTVAPSSCIEIPVANMLYKGHNFKGIFISDKIFFTADGGENTHVRDWLKQVIKEAIHEELADMRGKE